MSRRHAVARARRRSRQRRSFAIVATALALLGPRVSSAHDLAMDELLLRPDFDRGVLRGQLTFDPHRTTDERAAPTPALAARVLATVQRDLRIDIDGHACAARYEIRELWVPAGATAGDIVLLECPLPAEARELRVFAAPAIKALIVTVDASASTGTATSRSVRIPGGSSTPSFHFGTSSDWYEGGANQFAVGGSGAVRDDPTRAVARSRSAPAGVDATPVRASVGSRALRYLPLAIALVATASIAIWSVRRRRR